MADELTERIIGAAIEVHRILGPGFLESIYEAALCHEFSLRDIPFERQKTVAIQYKGQVLHGQRLDLVVAGCVVLELKATQTVSKALPDAAIAQLLSYLRATNLQRGLLINFGAQRLVDGIKRVSL